MGQKYAFNKETAMPRSYDDIVASFRNRLHQKYHLDLEEPLPDDLVDLLIRLDRLKKPGLS